MTETAYFKTVGGSVLLLDIPEEGTDAHSRHMLQVGKGELVVLDASTVEAVERDGATVYVVKRPDEPVVPAKPRGRAKKDESTDEPAGE